MTSQPVSSVPNPMADTSSAQISLKKLSEFMSLCLDVVQTSDASYRNLPVIGLNHDSHLATRRIVMNKNRRFSIPPSAWRDDCGRIQLPSFAA